MRRFLVARILLVGFVLFMIATLMFGMFVLLPGDPTGNFVEEGLSRKAVERQRELWGLDDPLHVQYLRYLRNLVTLQFGVSFRAQVPVREVLMEKFLNSIAMMLPALLLIMVGGTVLGAYLGWRRGSAVEKAAVLGGLAVESMPSFFAGILMLMLFSYGLGWLPSAGMGPSGSSNSFLATVLSGDFLRYAALPVLTLAIRGINGPMLLMRTSMIEIRGSDFLMLLEAKGLSEARVMVHAVRNAILPMITYFGVLIGTLFQGQVLLETVFGWPGIGRAVVDALAARDFPVLQGAFFLTAVVVVGMNLVVDILYGYLDPRVRVAGEELPGVIGVSGKVARDPLTALAALGLGVFVLIAAFGPLLAPHGPFETLSDATGTPLRLKAPAPGHWLGTTTRGHDVLSQMMYGARIALVVGVVSAVIAGAIGASVGLLSGYCGRAVDQVLMRLTDVAFGIPTLPFALIVVGILGPGVVNTIAVIAAILWRTQARVIRAQVLTIKERAYVRAARIAGAGPGRIMLLHIAPNILPFLLLYLALSVAQSVLLEAGLSFLGFSDPRVVTWGGMLNAAFEAGAVRTAWWWVLPPGFALSVVVVSSFVVVRQFEEAANPRLRTL